VFIAELMNTVARQTPSMVLPTTIKRFSFGGAGFFYVKLENSAAWPDKSKLVADLMSRNQILASNITILSNICYYYTD